MLVGSIPAPDARAAMDLAADALAPYLAWLPDGETGQRSRWIVNVIENLRTHPAFRVAKEGDWSSYDNRPEFRLRRGVRLDPASLNLGHLVAYRESRPAFDAVRAATARPDLRFQVGLPSAFDLALFALGPRGALRHRTPFRNALAAEVAAIVAESGGGADVVFQIEIPAELVFAVKAPGPLRPLVSAGMARFAVEVAAAAPANTTWGVHLCLGDLGHKALAGMTSAAPLTGLANAIARRWPAGRKLAYVHLPMCEGDLPASTDPRFYAPLAGLRVPAGCRVAAGFVHESASKDDLVATLGLIETALGGRVDVAASCGLGRRTAEQAAAVLERSRLLCEA
jgi:hypothetical protein